MKKKKILSMLLAVTLLFACIPLVTVPVSAATKTYFSEVTVTGYKGWLDADAGGQTRYKQRGYALDHMNGTNNLANITSGSAAAYQTSQVGDYYPEIYLNASGELVRDNTYDNVNTDVNLSTYLSSGLGKYYAYFKLAFDSAKKLNTFTVYNREAWWHLNRGFDILVSYDGTHWSKRGSYTNMGNYDNWSNGGKTVQFGGQNCLYLTVDMGGVNAKYVAVAVTEPAGGGPCCALQYAEATTGDGSFSVSTAADLQSKISFCSILPGGTINLTSDITCDSGTTNFGTLSGAGTVLNGQNHTIYNLRGSLVTINGPGINIKNLTISNKTANSGSAMSITGRIHLFGGEYDKIGGGTSANPVVIENVNNQRNVTGVTDMSGLYARSVGGYVTFKNCTNSGTLTANSGGNYKVGGFVGAVEDSGTVLTFQNCSNTGNISGAQVGGFLGVYKSDAGVTINMTGCANSGTIKCFSNSSARGMAGGLIGSVNNANDNPVSASTYITMTTCKNTGNILLDSTASNSQSHALGGLLGHAGYVTNTTTIYQIILTQCEVYNCSIDATDTDYSHGSYYAAGFVGKISPNSDSNILVKATNCYLSKVSVSAANARKFIGVGAFNVNVVSAENCMVYQLVEKNSSGATVSWNAAANAGLTRTFSASDSAKTGFADTDTSNLISGGGNSFCQAGSDTNNTTNKARFLATLPSGFSLEGAGYERVGFYIVALPNGATSGSTTTNVWIQQTWTVFDKVNANGTVMTASQIKSGAAYVFALPVRNVPKNVGTVNFYVTPYMIHNDGHIIFGQSYKCSLTTSGTIS